MQCMRHVAQAFITTLVHCLLHILSTVMNQNVYIFFWYFPRSKHAVKGTSYGRVIVHATQALLISKLSSTHWAVRLNILICDWLGPCAVFVKWLVLLSACCIMLPSVAAAVQVLGCLLACSWYCLWISGWQFFIWLVKLVVSKDLKWTPPHITPTLHVLHTVICLSSMELTYSLTSAAPYIVYLYSSTY